MSPPQYSDNSHYITQFYTLKVKAGASPSVLAESDALASFFLFFLFQSGSDRKDIRSSGRCGNVCQRSI